MTSRQMDKTLTISIAAYNVEGTLGRTLASLEVAPELMDHLEIIVVDDGSTDGTAQVAESFASKWPGIARVISKTNGGYGSTVNAAISEAGGRYFKLIDGDDTADREGLEGLIRYLISDHSADLVITPFIYDHKDINGNTVSSTLCDRHSGMQTSPVRLEDAILDDGLMMFEICVKTDVLRKSGTELTENCFYTDNEYVMAAELYSSEAVRYPLPVYRYSLGVEGQSMSVEGRRKHRLDKIRAAEGVFDILEKYEEGSGELSGTKRMLADKLVSTMVREIYTAYMLMEDPLGYRDELKAYDEDLRERRPGIYEISRDSRLVSTARKAGSATYRLLCKKVLADETRRTGAHEAGAEAARTWPKLLRASEYIVAACMIIQCRTVYMHLRDVGMIVNRSVWVVMMIALAVCALCTIRKGSEVSGADSGRTMDVPGGAAGLSGMKRTALICIVFAVYAGIYLAAVPVNPLRVIRCALAVIMMIILIRSDGGRSKSIDILCCFRDLMLIVAVVSLAGWLTGSVAKFLPCTAFLYMDWSATGEYVRIPTFMCLYFETQWTDWTLVQARNSGIFVEAPMAGCAYSIALMIECFITKSEDRRHRWSVILLVLAIFSTLSLISYGFLILTALAVMMVRRGNARGEEASGRTGRRLAAGGIALAAAALLFFIIRKLNLPEGNIRINDFAVGFRAWLAHPVFGGGFEDLDYLRSFMPEWREDIGFSNSPMEILAQGGLWLGIPYIYAFLASAIRAVRRRDLDNLVVTILFAYIFTFTVIPYQYITFFLIILMITDSLAGCRDGEQASVTENR